MLFNFCYIKGISNIDTLLFSSLQDQLTYFSNSVVLQKQVEGFYPPFYKDSIKLEKADINLESKVNYLYFQFDNKYYFYFIESLNYVNSGIVRLNLKLDTLQTYLFDFHFNGLIERKHIKRWNKVGDNYVINRDYVRENYSKGDFKNYSYTILNDNELCFLISKGGYKITIDNVEQDIDFTIQALNNNNNKMIDKSYLNYFILPLGIKEGNSITHRVAGFYDENNNWKESSSSIQYLIRKVETEDIFIIPFNPFGTLFQITTKGTGKVAKFYESNNNNKFSGITQLKVGVLQERPGDNHYNIISGFKALTNIYTEIKYSNIHLPFVRNTGTLISKTYEFEPCLIDENYVEVEVGDNQLFTTYPLSKINGTSIIACYFANVLDGSIYYSIVDSEYNINSITEEVFKNEYLQLKYNPLPIILDLINDKWEQYIANNKNRWGSFAVSSIGGTIEGVAIGGALKGGVGASIGLAKGLIGAEINSIQQLLKEDNIKYAPQTIKKDGKAESFMSKNANIFKRIKIKDDIEVAFEFYYKFGNLINKNIGMENNEFLSYINTRRYFNFVKSNGADIDLSMLLTSLEIKRDLEDRFNNGLRFWNQNIEIGNYTYDNLENDLN